MRRGFTLIELVIVLAIIVLLGSLIFGRGGCNAWNGYYDKKQSGVYQCVKTYTVTISDSSSKRVDLRPQQSHGVVETMKVDDDWYLSLCNSATIYAQFEAGKWYSVSSTGFRQESAWHPLFPTVTSATEIPAPNK